jgi:hypothetical protein
MQKSAEANLITITGYQGSGIEMFYNEIKQRTTNFKEIVLTHDTEHLKQVCKLLNENIKHSELLPINNRVVCLVNFPLSYVYELNNSTNSQTKELLASFTDIVTRFVYLRPKMLNLIFYWHEISQREYFLFGNLFKLAESEIIEIK